MKKLLIFLFIVACSSEDPTPVKLVPSNLYSTHIEAFYTEASERGLNLPQITPEVRFTSHADFNNNCTTNGGGYVTSLSYKQGDKYIIEITDRFEGSGNVNNFELPIFREMAHLLLNKPYEADPWLSTNGTSAANPMCQCTAKDLDWNGQRQVALDYLFQ